MDKKANSNQTVPGDPDRPEHGLSLNAAMGEFPRLFRGEPPRIPSWVLPGWQPLIKRLLTSIDTVLTDADAQDFRIIQVKEKSGTLSFYFQSPDRVRDQINDLVERASQESATCCVRCGRPAKLRDNGGWKAVLCADHQTLPIRLPGDL